MKIRKYFAPIDGDTRIKYERKSSIWELGPMGEVTVQYDGLAEPPALRVVDVQGGDREGRPQSDLPAALLPALKAAVTTQ